MPVIKYLAPECTPKADKKEVVDWINKDANFFKHTGMKKLSVLLYIISNFLCPIFAYAAPPPGTQWHLIFEDNFKGKALDTSKWTPGWFGKGITSPVNNDEKACYDSTQVTVPGDGYLHLTLDARQSTCKGSIHPYTGALVSSNPHDGIAGHPGFQFTYGYIEFRVYLPPSSVGVIANWPAMWTDGQNWPADGENDTVEGLRGRACYHFPTAPGNPGYGPSGDYTGWHTFASDWEPGIVT
jgi:beta-glucanase (GH16 family)